MAFNGILKLLESDKNFQPKEERNLIYLIDDDPVILNVLESHLKKWGFQVETFADTQQATSHIKAKHSDVQKLVCIITDIMMDNGDGLDLFQTFQDSKELKKIPFVMISGIDEFLFLEMTHNKNYVTFFKKPIAHDKLKNHLNKIKDLLNGKS